MENNDMDRYVAMFLGYASEFDSVPDAAPLRLKIEHTLRVYQHARRIIDENGDEDFFSGSVDGKKMVGRASILAALFHDCGRFPQFRQYRTFLDASSVNHAELSFQTLETRGFLRDEPDEVRNLAGIAVRLHNRYRLPEDLSDAEKACTDVVRDADKLDIFKVMVDYLGSALPERDAVLLHVEDNPEKWTPEVADSILNGNVGRYSDLHYVNDFRLLLGSWMYELRFSATRKALYESGLMEIVLSGLPEADGLRGVRSRLYAELRKCGENRRGAQ